MDKRIKNIIKTIFSGIVVSAFLCLLGYADYNTYQRKIGTKYRYGTIVEGYVADYQHKSKHYDRFYIKVDYGNEKVVEQVSAEMYYLYPVGSKIGFEDNKETNWDIFLSLLCFIQCAIAAILTFVGICWLIIKSFIHLFSKSDDEDD